MDSLKRRDRLGTPETVSSPFNSIEWIRLGFKIQGYRVGGSFNSIEWIPKTLGLASLAGLRPGFQFH